ncbi:Mannan-binding lectin serine protease 1 [Chamberlinius hualienensis]
MPVVDGIISQQCGLKVLECPCQDLQGTSIKMNVILCRFDSQSCEPCDQINDAIKCRLYQYYCRQMMITSSSISNSQHRSAPPLQPPVSTNCLTPKTPENGDVTFSVTTSNLSKDLAKVSVGTSVIYTCSHLYQINDGSVTSVMSQCLADGSWSATPPTCVAKCGKPAELKTPQIINGATGNIRYWPWQVGIYSQSTKSLICGGSLIRESWVLSAAHCFKITTPDGSLANVPPERIGMFFGQSVSQPDLSDPNVTKRKASGIIVHQQYDANTIDFDIALVKLDKPVKYNEFIRPICLPSPTSAITDIPDSVGLVAGWGKRSNDKDEKASPTLQKIAITVIQKEKCQFDEEGQQIVTLTENMFCAGDNGVGTCGGDSGGSLCFLSGSIDDPKYQIEGIVSWGIGNECAAPGHYDGFTRVRNFVNWINNFTFS